MDELEEPLQAMFAEHVDTVYRSLDTLQTDLYRAVTLLCEAMLNERKLLVCGRGVSAALAEAFCAALLGRNRMERPALPVILIGNEAATTAAISDGYGIEEMYSRQIHALAQSGDVLLLLSAPGNGAALLHALGAAHARNARAVLISGNDAGEIASLLTPADLLLPIPSDEPARIAECQLLVLNCLASLIETQLFGNL